MSVEPCPTCTLYSYAENVRLLRSVFEPLHLSLEPVKCVITHPREIRNMLAQHKLDGPARPVQIIHTRSIPMLGKLGILVGSILTYLSFRKAYRSDAFQSWLEEYRRKMHKDIDR